MHKKEPIFHYFGTFQEIRLFKIQVWLSWLYDFWLLVFHVLHGVHWELKS